MKSYNTPEIKVIELKGADVITSSGGRLPVLEGEYVEG